MEDTGRRLPPIETFWVSAWQCWRRPGFPGRTPRSSTFLLAANLRGVDTHGSRACPSMWSELRAGLTKGRAQGVVIAETPTTALRWAGWTRAGGGHQGHAVGHRQGPRCRRGDGDGAKLHALRHAAYYAMMALDKDMIGIALTNSPSLMAPWGGRKAFLGTNPLAIAVHCGEGESPSSSIWRPASWRGAPSSSRAKKGETIPNTWGLNRDGGADHQRQGRRTRGAAPLAGTRVSDWRWRSRS